MPWNIIVECVGEDRKDPRLRWDYRTARREYDCGKPSAEARRRRSTNESRNVARRSEPDRMRVHPQRSRQTTPLHSASKRWQCSITLARADALVRPFACLVRCHLFRSNAGFAIVADGFDRTSFHGFLAKRLLLRRGRLLKHIGVAAGVDARETSGCGFPAQVAVNALIIDVKLSRDVFRVFIRNVGHRFSFVSGRRKFD